VANLHFISPPYCVLYILHYTLSTLPQSTSYNLHSTIYTLQSTLYTIYNLFSIQSALYILHSTIYTLYNLHSTIYTLQSTLYNMHSTIYTLQPTLYNTHSTIYTLQSTFCSLHSTLYTLQSLWSTLNTTDERVQIDRQWPLSGVHSIMMVKSAQPGEGGGGCTRSPFRFIYHHKQSFLCTLQLKGQIHFSYFSNTLFSSVLNTSL
jgi:hypothetical protein